MRAFRNSYQATEEISPNIAQSTANVVNTIKPWHHDPSHGRVTNVALINCNIFHSSIYIKMVQTYNSNFTCGILWYLMYKLSTRNTVCTKYQKMLTRFEKATCKECHQKLLHQARLQYWSWRFAKLLILLPLPRLPSGPWNLAHAQTE